MQYPAQPGLTYQNTRDDTRLFDPRSGTGRSTGATRTSTSCSRTTTATDATTRRPTCTTKPGSAASIATAATTCTAVRWATPTTGRILRAVMEQAVAIDAARAATAANRRLRADRPRPGSTTTGRLADSRSTREGNPLRHVVSPRGRAVSYFLTSRLTGDVALRAADPRCRRRERQAYHPDSLGQRSYSERASYAMGRADGDRGDRARAAADRDGVHSGFAHSDNLSCASCHSSWTNTCIGCHLGGEYDNGNNFSNITGERIVFRPGQRRLRLPDAGALPARGRSAHNKIDADQPRTPRRSSSTAT